MAPDCSQGDKPTLDQKHTEMNRHDKDEYRFDAAERRAKIGGAIVVPGLALCVADLPS